MFSTVRTLATVIERVRTVFCARITEAHVHVKRTSLADVAIVARQELMGSDPKGASLAIVTRSAHWTISATSKPDAANVDPILMAALAASAILASGTSHTANDANATDTPNRVTRKPALASIVAITPPDTIAIDASRPSTVIHESGSTYLAELAHVQVKYRRHYNQINNDRRKDFDRFNPRGSCESFSTKTTTFFFKNFVFFERFI